MNKMSILRYLFTEEELSEAIDWKDIGIKALRLGIAGGVGTAIGALVHDYLVRDAAHEAAKIASEGYSERAKLYKKMYEKLLNSSEKEFEAANALKISSYYPYYQIPVIAAMEYVCGKNADDPRCIEQNKDEIVKVSQNIFKILSKNKFNKEDVENLKKYGINFGNVNALQEFKNKLLNATSSGKPTPSEFNKYAPKYVDYSAHTQRGSIYSNKAFEYFDKNLELRRKSHTVYNEYMKMAEKEPFSHRVADAISGLIHKIFGSE